MHLLGRLAGAIDRLNRRLGHAVAWLALAMVLVQFAVVLMRHAFGLGSVMAQEAVIYLHAIVFLAAAGYTLLADAHVRCDLFRARATPRRRALIDLLGFVFLLAPLCLLIGWHAWPYVAASWAVRESSPEGALGIPAVFVLKTGILFFVTVLGLQGLANALRAVATLTGAGEDR